MAVKKISQDICNEFQFNTVISKYREFANTIYDYLADKTEFSDEDKAVFSFAVLTFLKLLAPVLPHMTEEIYESKELLKQGIDLNNPEQTVELIGKILNTSDSAKMKLYAIGEILTKNKNDTIYELKGEINHLGKKISNQRLYINKLKKALSVSENKVYQSANQIDKMSEKIDKQAYQKAVNSYENNYGRKKIVVVKKSSKR
jgi:leucyl-tRNA synthetase